MLYDVTLVNLRHVVYSYASTIKDLMLHERERVMSGGIVTAVGLRSDYVILEGVGECVGVSLGRVRNKHEYGHH